MSQTVIAKRYAKALVRIAEKKKSLEKVEADLLELAETLTQSEVLNLVLEDVKIPAKTKEAILKEVMAKLETDETVNVFVRFLLAKRRVMLLADIAAVFKTMVQEKLGLLEAEVKVARKISEATAKALAQALSDHTGKTVTVNVTIDPQILGGVVTQIGSVVIDGSLRHQLSQVYQSIIRG